MLTQDLRQRIEELFLPPCVCKSDRCETKKQWDKKMDDLLAIILSDRKRLAESMLGAVERVTAVGNKVIQLNATSCESAFYKGRDAARSAVLEALAKSGIKVG